MKGAAGTHRFLFLGTAALALLMEAAGWTLSREWLIFLLVILVALAGLPHGALDPLVARKAALWKKPAGLAAFIGCYLHFAAAALGLWLLFPALSLAVFLAYSAWHFSGDWREKLPAGWRVWAGLAIVTVPAASHPAEVASIFAVLTDPATASLIVTAAGWLALPAIIGTLGAAAICVQRDWWTAIELISLAAAAWFLPPLAFFILYFCGLHSPRHLIDTARGLKPSSAVATGALFTLLAIALGLLAFSLLPDQPIDTAVLRLTFIGLAVLTVPHMILIEHAASRKTVRASAPSR